jgi:hypothetical protein
MRSKQKCIQNYKQLTRAELMEPGFRKRWKVQLLKRKVAILFYTRL